VRFAPTVALTDSTGAAVEQRPLTASLRPGEVSVIRLLATDNPELSPQGWQWSAQRELTVGGVEEHTFALPFQTGASRHLSELIAARPGGRSRTRRAVLAATAAGIGGIAAYTALRAVDGGNGEVSALTGADACIPPTQQLPVERAVVARFGRGWRWALSGAARTSDVGDSGRAGPDCGEPVATVVTRGDGVTYATLSSTQVRFDTTGKYLAVRYRLNSSLKTRTLELDVSNDKDFTRFFRWQFADRADNLGSGFCYDNEWEQIFLSFADAIAYGNPDRSGITALRLRAQDRGRPVTVQWQDVAVVSDPGRRFPRGIATICFDDIYETQYSHALPVLREHGFRATVAVIRQIIDHPRAMTLAQLQSLRDLGWEIGCHANTVAVHRATDIGVPLSVLTSDLGSELAFLHANGFLGDKILAYPSGRWNPGVLKAVSRYCMAGRLDFFRTQETFPPADPYKLRACGSISSLPGTHSAADVCGFIDAAAENRSWLILVFHKIITGTPVQETECRLADFREIIGHLAASRMPVMTTGEVMRLARAGRPVVEAAT